jgi:hypothetical protein
MDVLEVLIGVMKIFGGFVSGLASYSLPALLNLPPAITLIFLIIFAYLFLKILEDTLPLLGLAIFVILLIIPGIPPL